MSQATITRNDAIKLAERMLVQREYDRRNLSELITKLKNFTFFAEYISKRFGKPDYKHYPFSLEITKEYEQWSKTSKSRLIVNTPPQIGKTENCVILGTLYTLMFVNSRATFAYVTNESSLAFEKSGETRDIYNDILNSDIGEYLELSPLSKTQNSKKYWKTIGGFSFQAGGITSGWVGKGFDYLVIDDPYKDHEGALSVSGRRKIWRLWASSLSLRLSPIARVLLIHTRWHDKDLTWQIQDASKRKFKHILIPAIAKDGGDYLGRKDGEGLECRFTDEDPNYWVGIKQEKDAFFWESLYQQTPGDFVGKYFGRIVYGDWLPLTRVVGYIDTSFDGKDYCAFAYGGKRPSKIVDDKTVQGKYQVEVQVWPKNINDYIDEICNIVQAKFIKRVIVEKNADHGAFASRLREEFVKRGINCKVVDETESTNKHARIVSYVYDKRSQIIYSTDSSEESITQIQRYEENIKPCDAPDAVAGLIRELGRKVIKRWY